MRAIHRRADRYDERLRIVLLVSSSDDSLLPSLRKNVIHDFESDRMLELETYRMEMKLELLDDRDPSDGSQCVPENSGENVDFCEFVIDRFFMLANDLGKDMIGTAVKRAE